MWCQSRIGDYKIVLSYIDQYTAWMFLLSQITAGAWYPSLGRWCEALLPGLRVRCHGYANYATYLYVDILVFSIVHYHFNFIVNKKYLTPSKQSFKGPLKFVNNNLKRCRLSCNKIGMHQLPECDSYTHRVLVESCLPSFPLICETGIFDNAN